jgi:predicted dehydrogenase
MVRIAIVGYGYWGPNLVRNFSETKGAQVAAVCDLRPAVLEQVKTRYPGVKVTTEFSAILEDESIDAVALATPVDTHADLALKVLKAGKHVLVEKPLAPTAAAAREVVQEAVKRNKVLLVDHTFVYMGAVQKVRQLVEAGELGDLWYFDSVRVNLGLFQRDVSVLWDLAVHDLSILTYWLNRYPHSVSCIGVAHLNGHPKDIAYLTLQYADNLIAHVHVNWLSPVKVRKILLGGSKKMIVFDDLDPMEKIRIYDRGITRREDMVSSGQIPLAYRRTGDVWMPQFDMTEALKVEASHFVDCIANGAKPITGGEAALKIVEILEAAERSMQQNGKLVPL